MSDSPMSDRQMPQTDLISPAIAAPEGVIRKVVPSERQELLDHLMRLDPLSRFMRFGGVVSDAALARHATRALSGRTTVVGYFVEGKLRAVAELHPLPRRAGHPAAAEAAFSVERDFQGQGIGTELMRHIVLLARNRGIADVEVVFLPQNGRMKSLAVQHDADFSLDETEMIGHVHTVPATPFSWMREMAGDVSAVLAAAFELQHRLLPKPLRGN